MQQAQEEQQAAKQETNAATTSFGYEQVAVEDKVKLVAGVFDSVATKYDLMNDMMSLGIHRLWKKYTLELSGVRPGYRVLDIAGGTGDLTLEFSRLVGTKGQVILADINASMLAVGRDKLLDKGYGGNIAFVQANAECLPFPDNSFDVLSIAFGLRNVTNKDKALADMARILKPGGRLLVLEFSKPTNPLLSKIYDFYSFNALPLMGRILAGDSASYRYLAESIRMHPDQETLKDMLLTAGFSSVKYHNLTSGIVALHLGTKL